MIGRYTRKRITVHVCVYPGGPPAQVVTIHGQSIFARVSIIAGSFV